MQPSNKVVFIGFVIITLLIISFLPIFSKEVMDGTIKINAWDKIMTSLRVKHID